MCEEYDPDKDVRETGGRRGMALAEIIMQKRNDQFLESIETSEVPITKRRKRVAGDSTYRSFLERAEKTSYNDISTMREILPVFFGARFGPKGKTPISEMENSQVFGAYSGMVSYARRRVNIK